jgi:hypothetical protein
MAYKFIEAGADIIAGHHPHVIQPYEKYRNGHIFYSLGNFIFNYIRSKKFSIGMLATCEITDNNEIKVHLKGVKLSYKKLVEEYNDFYEYYEVIQRKYNSMKDLSEEEYMRIYKDELKFQHLRERIIMKTSLIREFKRIGYINSYKLISNVIRHYFNKAILDLL